MKVFIVESDEQVGLNLKLMAEAAGARVCGSACDLDSANRSMESSGANLVILDCVLGNNTFSEMLSFIMKHRSLSVLVLSDYGSPELCTILMSRGARGFITKADVLKSFSTAIKLTARGERYISSTVFARISDELPDAPAESSEPDTSRHPRLTLREQEVLELMLAGIRYTEIAGRLGVSVSTVHTYKERIMAKYRVDSIQHLVVRHAQLSGKFP